MHVDLSQPTTQEQFGAMVGISQPAVSDLIAREILSRDVPVHAWLLAYCSNLREVAAGRAANGDLDLAGERARLAREQADRIAMQNAQLRKELAPVNLLEQVLAQVSRQVAGILESIPVHLKRRASNLTGDDLAFIQQEIVRARNLAAAVQLDVAMNDGDVGDPEGNPLGAQAA